MTHSPPRLYRYVGPDQIRRAAETSPAGTSIRCAEDLRTWLASHPEARGEGATFVVAADGTLRVAPRRSEHVACSGGEPVLAAGEMVFDQRPDRVRIVEVTNQSTGFCPDPDCWTAIKEAAARAGIETHEGLTRSFVFRRCIACGSINVVKEGWFVCGVCEADLPHEWNFAD